MNSNYPYIQYNLFLYTSLVKKSPSHILILGELHLFIQRSNQKLNNNYFWITYLVSFNSTFICFHGLKTLKCMLPLKGMVPSSIKLWHRSVKTARNLSCNIVNTFPIFFVGCTQVNPFQGNKSCHSNLKMTVLTWLTLEMVYIWCYQLISSGRVSPSLQFQSKKLKQ